MKYTIKLYQPSDPLFSPWDIVVENTRHPNVLTVQPPHPYAGANLLGFEENHADLINGGVDVHEEGWPSRCQHLHPVLAGKEGGMFTLMGLNVEAVHIHTEDENE